MNKNSWTGILVLLICCCYNLTTYAQKKKQQLSQGIKVIASPYRDSILLRWAPSNAMLWKAANESGYMIKRYTMVRKGKLLSVPEEVTFVSKPVKPWPLNAWEQVLKVNERYGAIAAQGLYGEGFQLTAEEKKGKQQIMSVYHQSEEQESRYSFTVFSADQSYLVAQAAGLAFTDRNTRSDEKYLYRLYMADNPYKVKTDTGFVFTGFSDAVPVPAPYDLQVQSSSGAVLLSWNKALFDHIFTAYIVERSDDKGKTFHSISEYPIVNTAQSVSVKESQRLFWIDSVQQKEQLIVYRLKGLTPFGELSPASDTVQIILHERLDARPSITSAVMLSNQVNIKWTMPYSKATVSHFEVERAAAVTKKYSKINKDELQAKDSSFVDLQPRSSNYYRIKATTKDGQSVYSIPVFVQAEDSIPPAPPVGLAGKIDDKGIVSLTWLPNAEEDIFAYRVFRANDPHDEFVQITREPQKDPAFKDTIILKTLTKKIYYKVVALDGRFNPSDFSDALELKKPDVVPPVPPVFTDLKSTDDGVWFSWQPSSSDDVVRHEVLRKQDTGFYLLQVIETGDTTHNYKDTGALPGIQYQYAVVAVDDSQLRSSSKLLTGSRINMGHTTRPLVKAVIDRDTKTVMLSWKKQSAEKIWLYRAESGKPLVLYKTLTGDETSFKDNNLFVNTIYRYKLKIMSAAEGSSCFTDEVIVNY